MRHAAFLLATLLASGSTAIADEASTGSSLTSLSFLIGSWGSGRGSVADTGGTSTGTSTIEPMVGGAVLLRRDRVTLFDASGKPSGAFEIFMMIYRENGAIRADYDDGQHVIHYTSADVVPGKSVVFKTDPSPSAPSFRLQYVANGANEIAITFDVEAPGATTFHPIAAGTLERAAAPAPVSSP